MPERTRTAAGYAATPLSRPPQTAAFQATIPLSCSASARTPFICSASTSGSRHRARADVRSVGPRGSSKRPQRTTLAATTATATHSRLVGLSQERSYVSSPNHHQVIVATENLLSTSRTSRGSRRRCRQHRHRRAPTRRPARGPGRSTGCPRSSARSQSR